jgi:hypothetical protein
MFARQADFSEQASTKNKKGRSADGNCESSETTCLHVKQISEVEEEAESLNSNWSRASELVSRPGFRSPAAAFVRPGAEPAGSDPAWAVMKCPAAASVRPEAKLAGSVSAWAEVLGTASAEGEESLAGAVSGGVSPPTRYWIEPKASRLAPASHSSPAQAQIDGQICWKIVVFLADHLSFQLNQMNQKKLIVLNNVFQRMNNRICCH